MFTRKNKGGEVNKKTRKDKDSKSNQQKGGGLTAEEEKTYYETLVSIIYDSDLKGKFDTIDALSDSLKETNDYIKNEQNAIILNVKASLDLINQYNKIALYNVQDIKGFLTHDDNERIKLLNNTYKQKINELKEQVNRVSQIIFKYSGELTNDKTLLYTLLNELTIYNDNNAAFEKTTISDFMTKHNQPTTVIKTNENKPISDLNIFPPDNSQNSCWLNSILMALLVPVYLDGNNEAKTLTQIKKFENFKNYMDSYLAQNVNRPKGIETLQNIKGSIFFEDTTNTIKNQFHNVDSFLEHSLFNTYFNNSMKIEKTVYDRKNDENKKGLIIPLGDSEQKHTIMFSREETVKYADGDDKIIFSIDKNKIQKSYQYEIKTNLKYLIFQCDGEGNFTESLQQLFLKETLIFKTQTNTISTYKRVSFVLATGGHYVSVVKKNNSYYLINDVPPTITIFTEANVKEMISNRSKKIQNYYYLNVIVYMLDETQPAALIKASDSTSTSIKTIDNSTSTSTSIKPIDNSTSTSTSTKKIDNSTSIQKNSVQDIKDDTLNKSLIEEANKTMELTKDSSFSSSDDTEKSLTDAANVAMNSQKKTENELILLSSNDEIQSVQPSQPSQSDQTYTIQFDTNVNVKSITKNGQISQSLSDEIEDHYFKGNPGKYIPKNTNYTVTVTKDMTGKITIDI